jgi:phosphonate transport system substrate-binding protein
MAFKPLLLLFLIFPLVGCQPDTPPLAKLSVGAVSLGQTEDITSQYDELKTYLASQLGSAIELEPTYNERKALDQIKRQNWDLAFAPAGLAAIAVSQFQYKPLFPLEGNLKARSVIAVRRDSPLRQIRQLAGKVVALGETGSATSYYLPIYNLYGLTLAEVRSAPTPQIALQWLAEQKVAAAAMSLDDFNRHRSKFPKVQFRILYTDAHPVPLGAVIISQKLNAYHQKAVRAALANASPSVIDSVGYITNAPAPDYSYLIEVVKRVSPIARRIRQKPVPLYEEK